MNAGALETRSMEETKMRRLALAIVILGQAALAQPPSGGAGHATYQDFRAGFVARIAGGGWSRSQTVSLSSAECGPANASPCAGGAKPVEVQIRFAPLPHAVELYKALSAIGEVMPPGRARYMVRTVPANQSNAVCGAGMTLTEPMATLRVSVKVANPGPQLPITCRWTVLGANEDAQAPAGFDVVWSDTITVQIVRRR